MPSSPRRPASGGRAAEADRNDVAVLAAAREVFLEQGWDAPMAAVAARAGVGTGSVYRRYADKTDLLRRMCAHAIAAAAGQARTALDEEADGWSALRRFTHAVVRARSCALFVLVGGSSELGGELGEAVAGLHAAVDALVAAAHAEHALRPGVTGADVYLALTMLRLPLDLPEDRAGELRLRVLDVVLAGLAARPDPLPGHPADWADMSFSDAPDLG